MPDNLNHAQRQERKDDIKESVREVLKEILPELFQQELGKAIWADMRPARTREQIRDYLQEALAGCGNSSCREYGKSDSMARAVSGGSACAVRMSRRVRCSAT